MQETVFTNARLVLPDEVREGTLLVRAGRIADIGSGGTSVPGAIDLEGDLLTPGLVEVHTDHLEKHLVPRSKVFWPAFSAVLAHDAQVASAGITTVLDAIAIGDTLSKADRQEILEAAVTSIADAAAGGHLRADHYVHLRLEVSNPKILELYDAFADDPRVRLVSLMDHTPGDRQYIDVARFKASVVGSGERTMAQIEAFVAERQAEAAEHSHRNRVALAAAARSRGTRLASHDDGTIAHVEEAVGLGVTISEFPTTLIAAESAHDHGLKIVMGAPNVVRGGSHSGNVAARVLAAEGHLDALSSDYMPISLIMAPFKLAEDEGIGLHEAMRLVTKTPAEMVGLDDRGALIVGRRADLVHVHLADGRPVPRMVMVEGRRVA